MDHQLLLGRREVNALAVLAFDVLSCCCTFVPVELKLKLLLMRQGTSLLPFLFLTLLAPNLVLAQNTEDPTTVKSTSKSTVNPSRLKLNFEFASGMGEFTDLRIPEQNELLIAKYEGKEPQETVVHRGFPVVLGMGYDLRQESWHQFLDFRLTNISGVTGTNTEGVRSSRYSRLELIPGAEIFLPIGVSTRLPLGLNLVARRSVYSNVSKSHYHDYLMPRMSAGIDFSKKVGLKLYAGKSVYSKFGYNQGKNFANNVIPGATADTTEAGANLFWNLTKLSQVALDASQENTHVFIPTLGEYRSFGLDVPLSYDDESREFDLYARIIKISLTRYF